MKKQKKNKSGGLKHTGLIVLFSAVLVYVVFSMIVHPVTTTIACDGTMENVINTNGYVIRDETVIEAPVSGMLSCSIAEGERVSRSSKIADIYLGDIDDNSEMRLSRINELLSSYGDDVTSSEYSSEDVNSAEFQIGKIIVGIVSDMQTKDMISVDSKKIELDKITDRYKSGDELTSYDELVQEKAKIENSLKAERQPVFSPVAGVFSSKMDGYESFFETDDLTQLKASLLDEADKYRPDVKTNVEAGQPMAKVFDNYRWYYAAIIDSSIAKDLKINDSIKLRFSNVSNEVLPATIASINTDSDGRVTLVASCSYYEELIYKLRKTNVEIVLGTYRGLQIPKSAIRVMDDGSTGVYISRDGVARYRKVNIIYAGDKNVIVEEVTDSSQMHTSLMLYDEVIVSGRNLKDGKKL